MRRIKEQWKKLISGLYVPPMLGLAPWYSGDARGCCCGESLITPCTASECFDKFDGTEVTVDLGVGGWTNDNCIGGGDCEDVAGEIILPFVSASGTFITWSLETGGYCTSSVGGPYDRSLTFYFECSEGEDKWISGLSVYVDFNYPVSTYSSATYLSDIDTPTNQCPEIKAYTVSKDNETHRDPAEPCQGTLPATVICTIA